MDWKINLFLLVILKYKIYILIHIPHLGWGYLIIQKDKVSAGQYLWNLDCSPMC
jgi:hypothetical protein